jgi:4-amino-4-deoxy-L-arabinose transferase-like glycosyltransferase
MYGGVILMLPSCADKFILFVKEKRFQGLMNNPNHLQMVVTVAMSCCLYQLLKKDISVKYFCVVFGILSVCGLLTLSKAFIATYLILLFILLLYGFKQDKKKITIVLSVIIFTGIISFIIFNHFFDSLINRLLNGNPNASILDKLLSGRLSIWNEYLKEWSLSINSILFGRGVTSVSSINIETHNSYIKFLCDLGILGIIFVISLLSETVLQKPLATTSTVYFPEMTSVISAVIVSGIL